MVSYPLAVSFGISKPEHVKYVLREWADIAVVGSRLVKKREAWKRGRDDRRASQQNTPVQGSHENKKNRNKDGETSPPFQLVN